MFVGLFVFETHIIFIFPSSKRPVITTIQTRGLIVLWPLGFGNGTEGRHLEAEKSPEFFLFMISCRILPPLALFAEDFGFLKWPDIFHGTL
jgi:hypothetical protein